jgi:hypothetical protein
VPLYRLLEDRRRDRRGRGTRRLMATRPDHRGH